MYPYWSTMQLNEKQRHNMAQQSFNQGFFQCQQNFPWSVILTNFPFFSINDKYNSRI
jgi:hypothetical protein